MKMRIISVISALSIFLSIFVFSVVSANALPSYVTCKATASTDVYCLPSNTSSMKIGSISANESVKVYWAEGSSYYIEYTVSGGGYSGYKRGYVPKSKISTPSSTVLGNTYKSKTAQPNITQTVYNRSNTSSLSIGTVYSSDTITILQEDGSWYYIQYPAGSSYKRGYIPKKNIATYHEMGWRYPLDSSGTFRKISQGYSTNHKGLDIISTSTATLPIKGAVIKSPTSGKIKYSGEDDSAGFYVLIETNSVDPYNGHIITVGIQHMRAEYKGDKEVKSGTVLGEVWDTGNATGPHLHLFMRSDDEKWTNRDGRTINPQAFYPNVSFTGDTSKSVAV